jgi:hypothetical protein
VAKVRPNYSKQLERWSSQHSWVARAKAYDTAELSEQLEERREVRERARQILVDATPELMDKLLAFARGEAPKKSRNSDVSHRVQLTAIKEALALSGIIAPKRIEISGPDGREIEISARRALEEVDQAQLLQIRALLGRECG